MIKYVGIGLAVLTVAVAVFFLFPSDLQKIKKLMNTSVEKVEKMPNETTLETGLKLKWVKEKMTQQIHFVFPDAGMDETVSRDDLIYQVLIYRGSYPSLDIKIYEMEIDINGDAAEVTTIIEAAEVRGEQRTPRDVREVHFTLTKTEDEWHFAGAKILPLPTE